jgi:erythromycin esterase
MIAYISGNRVGRMVKMNMYNRLLEVILLFIGLTFSLEALSQKVPSYVPLNSFSPNETDYSDLQQIPVFEENVKVVGLGESTHGTREFSLMRHRIFRFLVQEKQFNTLFLEADYGSCLPLNRYIQGEDENLEEAVELLRLWPWKTVEFREMAEWMRDYNFQNPTEKLNLVGCDVQFESPCLIELNRILVLNGEPEVCGFYSDDDLIMNEALKDSLPEWWEAFLNRREAIKIDSLEYHILLNSFDQLISKSDDLDAARNHRDSCMAVNIDNYLEDVPETRGIFWGHNEHIRIMKPNSSLKRAGAFLKEKLRDTYMAIGLETAKGTLNAIGFDKEKGGYYGLQQFKLKNRRKMLGSLAPKQELFFVLSNSVQNQGDYLVNSIGSIYSKRSAFRKRYCTDKGLKSYDAIIFIRHSTPTTVIGTDKRWE